MTRLFLLLLALLFSLSDPAMGGSGDLSRFSFAAKGGADFLGGGRLGGELYGAGKLAQLESYLGKRGVTLQVGDEFLPAGKAGAASMPLNERYPSAATPHNMKSGMN